jgi:hypothetical protein
MEDLESKIIKIVSDWYIKQLQDVVYPNCREFGVPNASDNNENFNKGVREVIKFQLPVQALTKLVEVEKEKLVEDLFHKFNMGVLELNPVTHDMSITTVVAHFRVKLFGTFQDTLTKLTDSKVGKDNSE